MKLEIQLVGMHHEDLLVGMMLFWDVDDDMISFMCRMFTGPYYLKGI